jgi:hypothetical protein
MYVCIRVRIKDISMAIKAVAIGTNLHFVSAQTKTLIPASRHLYSEVRVALSRRGSPVLSTLCPVRVLQVHAVSG